MKNVILVCEDLFGLEVFDLLVQSNLWYRQNGREEAYRVLGYVSDAPDPFGDTPCPLARLGTLSDHAAAEGTEYVLGIAGPAAKVRAVEAIKARGGVFATVYCPWILAIGISVGEGSVVAAYSIKPGMELGPYTTTIESMLTPKKVGAYSTILRFSNITGNVGERAYVGNHVYSHLGVTIGDDAVAQDGAIIVRNVKPGMTVAGVPARRVAVV